VIRVARARQFGRDLTHQDAGTRRQHGDAIGEKDRLLDVVGDQHGGEAMRLVQLQNEVVQLDPGQRIDRAERLVHQQETRLRRKRAGDDDALLHAARQLPRIMPAEGLETDHRQESRGVSPRADPARVAVLDRERDVVEGGAPGQQRAGILLKTDRPRRQAGR